MAARCGAAPRVQAARRVRQAWQERSAALAQVAARSLPALRVRRWQVGWALAYAPVRAWGAQRVLVDAVWASAEGALVQQVWAVEVQAGQVAQAGLQIR